MGGLSALPHSEVGSVHSKIGPLVVNGNDSPTKQETLIEPLAMASRGKDEKPGSGSMHSNAHAMPSVRYN